MLRGHGLGCGIWFMHWFNRPRYSRVTACPASVTLRDTPIAEAQIQVEVTNIFRNRCQPKADCSLELYLRDEKGRDDGAVTCEGHTEDGLHCFRAKVKETGHLTISLQYKGRHLFQRGTPATLISLPAPLDVFKSSYQIHTTTTPLKAGQNVKVKVFLLDEQGKEFNRITNLSFILIHNKQERMVHTLMSSKSYHEFNLVLVREGPTIVRVKADGNTLSYSGHYSDDTDCVHKELYIEVIPEKAHRISFEKVAYSMRGDGKIKHSNSQLWVGVQYEVAVKQVYDKYYNNTHLESKLVALLGDENTSENLEYESSLEALKLTISKVGLYQLYLLLEGNIVGHDLPRLKVEHPPLDASRSNFSMHAKSSALTAGDSVTAIVSLIDVQGNGYHGTSKLSFSRWHHGRETEIHSHFTNDGSDLQIPVLLRKSGNVEICLKANGHNIGYTGCKIGQSGLLLEGELNVIPGKLQRIVFEEKAYSLRRDGKKVHDKNTMWVGVKYIATIKAAFDEFENNTKVQSLIPSLGTDYLRTDINGENSDTEMTLEISKAGKHLLNLVVGGENILHNISQLIVMEPPIDCDRSTYEIIAKKSKITAGDYVTIKVMLMNVQGGGFKGPADLTFTLMNKEMGQCICDNVVGRFDSLGTHIVKTLELCQAGCIEILVSTQCRTLRNTGIHFEEEGKLSDTSWVNVVPGEVKTILFQDQAYSLRRCGKVTHANNKLWLGVKCVIAIKQAFDGFQNETTVHEKVTVSLGPSHSARYIQGDNTATSLEIKIIKPGTFTLNLEVNGSKVQHNIPQIQIEEPPCDPHSSFFEVFTHGSIVRAGDKVKVRITLKNVEGGVFVGQAELSFYRVENGNQEIPVSVRKLYSSTGRYIVKHIMLCKIGSTKIAVKASGLYLENNGVHYETDGTEIPSGRIWIDVQPGEARSIMFDKMAYSQGRREERINHPSNQVWTDKPGYLKIIEAKDFYGNITNVPERLSISLTPHHSCDRFRFDPDLKQIMIFLSIPGSHQLAMNYNDNSVSHNITQLKALSPSKIKLTVMDMYDYDKYAENDGDSMPLMGKSCEVQVNFHDEKRRTIAEDDLELVWNNDPTFMQDIDWISAGNILTFTPLNSDKQTDTVWLKLKGMQTDAGIKVHGLEKFKEDSIQKINHMDFTTIFCYHGARKIHRNFIIGDDRVNLQNIARATGCIIDADDVNSEETGVSLDLDIDEDEEDGDDSVYNMIKMLMVGRHFRQVATYHGNKRKHFAIKSQQAYKNNDFENKAPSVLKEVKCAHSELMNLAHEKAMDAYFKFHNENRPLSEIDLHDLRAYKNKADEIPGEAVDKLKERMNNPQLISECEWLEIIVGAGHHSGKDGPQIRPVVEKFLKEHGTEYMIYRRAGNKYDVVNKGSLLITFKYYRGPQPCFGQFYCPECHKVWWSRYSWAGYRQKCIKCERSDSLPHKLCEERPYYGPMLKKKHWKKNPVHKESICEKCKELGYLCLNLNSETNVTVAKYT